MSACIHPHSITFFSSQSNATGYSGKIKTNKRIFFMLKGSRIPYLCQKVITTGCECLVTVRLQ
jgi:hypothetical protein